MPEPIFATNSASGNALTDWLTAEEEVEVNLASLQKDAEIAGRALADDLIRSVKAEAGTSIWSSFGSCCNSSKSIERRERTDVAVESWLDTVREATEIYEEELRGMSYLRELKSILTWPYFRQFLTEILLANFNRVKIVRNTDWRKLDIKETQSIAKSLSSFIIFEKSVETAIDSWRVNYPSMKLVLKEHRFFLPFMEQLGYHMMSQLSLGLMARVGSGALLSMVDGVTDALATASLFLKEDFASFWLMLSTLSASMAITFIIGLIQKIRSPNFKTEIAWLFLMVVTYTKPGFDSYRVAMGIHQTETEVFTPLQELQFCRAVELGVESTVGSCLYAFVILKSARKGEILIILLSFLTSCMTNGFISGSISYDQDASPTNRRKQPKFYGYLGDDNFSRMGGIFSLTLISTSMCISASFTLAMTAVLYGNSTVALCVSIFLGIYFLFKLLRKDFFCFFPLKGKSAAVLMAVLFRTVELFSAYFSGLVQLRHPYQCGGLNYTCIVLANFFCLVMISMKYVSFADECESSPSDDCIEISSGATSGDIKVLLTCCLSAFSFGTLLLLLTMRKGYLNSFTSTATGSKYTCELFQNSDDDAVKARAAFTNNQSYISPISAEVSDWVQENWKRWMTFRPSWFNVDIVGAIPNTYLVGCKVPIPENAPPNHASPAQSSSSPSEQAEVVRTTTIISLKSVDLPTSKTSTTHITTGQKLKPQTEDMEIGSGKASILAQIHVLVKKSRSSLSDRILGGRATRVAPSPCET